MLRDILNSAVELIKDATLEEGARDDVPPELRGSSTQILVNFARNNSVIEQCLAAGNEEGAASYTALLKAQETLAELQAEKKSGHRVDTKDYMRARSALTQTADKIHHSKSAPNFILKQE